MPMPLDHSDPRDSLAELKNNCYDHAEITLIQINAGLSNGSFSAIITKAVCERELQGLPKIRDGLLDEATAWEEWYFQPIW
jgi:hypothetical protein